MFLFITHIIESLLQEHSASGLLMIVERERERELFLKRPKFTCTFASTNSAIFIVLFAGDGCASVG